ncbi:hypothetical protein CWRG_01344 [Chthonomonas calidirosea]|uniref:hypothetical protein n=1 Tax=Chthonomonas calidirosea TaxID=454171 RepID=UPI0006DD43F8|nr:hypothetical protein [Chthonomonas calidirosea]CEK16003.1 hypothetical protein CWRG_01344 [Chthonomonas calidirosea]
MMAKNGSESTRPVWLSDNVVTFLQRVFLTTTLIALLLIGYLLYGLLSGRLADAAQSTPEAKAHAMWLVQNLSLGIDIVLPVAILTGCVLFLESEVTPIVLLLLSGFFAYGVNFLIDYLSANNARIKYGPLSTAALSEVRNVATMLLVPGILLFLRETFRRIRDARYRQDLLQVKYGGDVKKENVPRALIGALAKCWQLPYCRSSIRVRCPIYLARTRCWRERVGCMCEESIVILAMGKKDQDEEAPQEAKSGFTPIGDLITKHEAESQKQIPTRKGPRGVRIPVNPYLSAAQKRERCRRCVIYQEHERQKYQLVSSLVIVAVPIVVVLNFNLLLNWMTSLLQELDVLIGKLSFIPGGTPEPLVHVTNQLTDSTLMEGILVICLVLLALSAVLRGLEYLFFNLQI